MPLFKLNNINDTYLTYQGIRFTHFINTPKLFEMYNNQQENMMFTNCFEYVNKNNLNQKYQVVYLFDNDKIYLFMYRNKEKDLLAYNYESYAYLLKKYGLQKDIKFVSDDELSLITGKYKIGTTIYDAIYGVEELCTMPGKKYKRMRERRNTFANHNETEFRLYESSDKDKVIHLYNIWKDKFKNKDVSNIKDASFRQKMRIVSDAKIFKSGLQSDYLEKFVLEHSDGSIIGFVSIYIVRDWLYIFSMKTLRGEKELSGTNVYLVHCLWNYIAENYPEVRYINLGGMSNYGWEHDFKERLKPEIYLKNHISVTIK